MAKQTVLLVDNDLRNLRVLEVSLRKAGYDVIACSDAEAALQVLSTNRPDIAMLDTRLPQLDGFGLVEVLRARREWADLPCIFLSSDPSVHSQVRALELGVKDYLTKPAYISEILTRIALILQRRRRAALERPESNEQTRFAGQLADMSVVDLMQAIDNGRKSGTLHVASIRERGSMHFQQGQLVDAELGDLRGERAVYRMLLWEAGRFEFDIGDVHVGSTISTSTQGVLMEGMRRVDEWDGLTSQLPSLDSIFEINDVELVDRLAEIPDEVNAVLRHVDGKRTLMDVVDAAQGDELEILSTLAKLYAEGLIYTTANRSDTTTPEPSPSRSRVATESFEPPALDSSLQEAPAIEEEAPRTSLRPSLSGALRVRRGRRRRPEHVRTLNTIPPGATAPGLHDTQSYPPTGGEDAAEAKDDESAAASRQRRRRKRLALATSPGLLSVTGLQESRVSLSPPTLASALIKAAEPPQTLEITPHLRPTTPAPHSPSPGLPSELIVVAPPSARFAIHDRLTTPAPQLDSSEGATTQRSLESPESTVAANLRPTSPAPQGMVIQAGAVRLDDTPKLIQQEPEPPRQAPSPSPPVLPHLRPNQEKRATPLAHPEIGDELDSPWDATAVTLAPPRRSNMLPITVAASALVIAVVLFMRSSSEVDEPSLSQSPAGPGEQSSAASPQGTPQTPKVVVRDASTQEANVAEASQHRSDIHAMEGLEGDQVRVGGAAMPDAATPPAANASALPEAAINAILLKAQQLDREGKRTQASALYEQVLESAPGRSDVLSHLAFNYLNNGRNKDAEEYAARAVAVDPRSSEGWIVLGAARHVRGDVTGAHEAYRRCAEQATGDYVTECQRMLR